MTAGPLSDPTTVVRARDSILEAEVGGESVLLDPDGGIYYGSNSVGTAIWKLLEEPRTVAELTTEITTEYDVDPDRAATDVEEFLETLHASDLIRIEE